ncbi:MAG: hypothetical protein FJ102_09485 [Deltaproteobacteria bacterium]|nr:hypothetical protein [Deltaproteobacteria bacterium]
MAVQAFHRTLVLAATDRAGVRAEVLAAWIEELPGTPSERNTYRYDVEFLSDGGRVYLRRPAWKNKGADFVVYCEGFTRYKNGNDAPPSHGDLQSAMRRVAARSPSHRAELLLALRRIWDCEASGVVLADLNLLRRDADAERALLVAKWLFIEQDVTYWTESGRHMLRRGLEAEFGALP